MRRRRSAGKLIILHETPDFPLNPIFSNFPASSRLIVLFLGMTFIVRAQEQKGLAQPDSTPRSVRPFRLEMSLYKTDFLLPPAPTVSPEDFPWFFRQTLRAPLPTVAWELQENVDLHSIWQQELARQNKHRTLRTILGSVQAGTVAYLTYLHLKKYGFKYK